jgi:FixJ family two-component response regulator
VVVSSDQDPTLDVQLQKLGASRFLRKPLRFAALYEALGGSLPEPARPAR